MAHLVVFYYKNISWCTVLWLSNTIPLFLQQKPTRRTISQLYFGKVLYQNKVEKWRISLSFIIRIYHDARSSEMSNTIQLFL